MKHKSHKQLNKILIIILIFATFIMNINIANAATSEEWVDKTNAVTTRLNPNTNAYEDEYLFGTPVSGHIMHPNFFNEKIGGSKGACECGKGQGYEKSEKFSKNKGKNVDTGKSLNLKLKIGEPFNKDVKAGGFIEKGIYYPTCEEFTYFLFEIGKDPLNNKKVSIVGPMGGNFEPYKPTTEEQKGDQNKNDAIDVSGMYKPNKSNDEPEPITLGKDAGDNDDYFGTGITKHIDFTNEGSTFSINNLFNWVKSISNIVLGLSIVIGLGSIVYLFISLGINSSNPQARSKIKSNLIIVCTATALATSLGTVFNFIVNKIAGI